MKKGPPPKLIVVKTKLELPVWKPECLGKRDEACVDDRFCADFFEKCKETTCTR